MTAIRLWAIALLIAGALLGNFVYGNQTNEDARFPFKFGLDLQGGTHLVYVADTSEVPENEVEGAMAALRDVIERRTNLFGVSEPLVQVEEGGAFAGETQQRLIVELPGVTDTEEAIRLIGETPLLEFKLLDGDWEPDENATTTGPGLPDEAYITTGLTGRFLERATLQFGQGSGLSNEPIVVIDFDSEGADLFEELTRENVGEVLAIFLDGQPISTPVIREVIAGGTATISGNFDLEEARTLVRDLNYGALPLPIELLSTQTIGASLGEQALDQGLKAGMLGLALVAIFLVLWYRLPGLIAVISLGLYILMMLAFFQLIPITLTAAGVAGFILSIGMAVDANILIFERMKEEFREGRKDTEQSIRDGFARAWVAIRDGNLSSIITAIILFWFGTSLVEGFALTFGLGILVSMFTAITVSRSLLLAIGNFKNEGTVRFLFGSGLKR
jgi:protein-export membrane protein SecD